MRKAPPLPKSVTAGESLDAILDRLIERAAAGSEDPQVKQWLEKLLEDEATETK